MQTNQMNQDDLARRLQRIDARRFLETPVLPTGFDELIETPQRRPFVQIPEFEENSHE